MSSNIGIGQENCPEHEYVTEKSCDDKHQMTLRWTKILTSVVVAFLVATFGSVSVGYLARQDVLQLKLDNAADLGNLASKVDKSATELSGRIDVRTTLVDERQRNIVDKLQAINVQLEKMNERQEKIFTILRENK